MDGRDPAILNDGIRPMGLRGRASSLLDDQFGTRGPARARTGESSDRRLLIHEDDRHTSTRLSGRVLGLPEARNHRCREAIESTGPARATYVGTLGARSGDSAPGADLYDRFPGLGRRLSPSVV